MTTPDGTGWRYRYDPFGRRIAKQRLGPDGAVVEQTDFTWDGPVLAEQSSSMIAGCGSRVRKSGASTGECVADEDGAGECGADEDGAGESGGSMGEDGDPAGKVGEDGGSAHQADPDDAGESGTGERSGWVVTWNYRPGSCTPLTQSEHIPAADLAEAPQEQIDRRFYAIVTDLVGSPTELTDPDGTLAGHQQHTLWGHTSWRGRADTPLRFPGQYADPETGLHYNQHRYYDPEVGAYLTPDPLGLAAAPNPHAYVMNPQVLADPLGLAPYVADQSALPAGSPGTVIRNRMLPREVPQAQSIVDFQGGTFVGNTIKNAPGIDGFLNGAPVSLKAYSGSSPDAVLTYASKAERSALRAHYSGVTVYIDAPNVDTSRLLDFAQNGPLQQIPRQGTVSSIYVHTSGGWAVIP